MTQPMLNQPQQQQRPSRPRAPTLPKETPIDFNLLKQWNSPDFIKSFKQMCTRIKPSNAQTFFTTLIQGFSVESPKEAMQVVLENILDLVKNDQMITRIMLSTGVFYYFPFKNPEMQELCFTIYYHSILHCPYLVSREFLQIIRPILPDVANKILLFLVLYFRPGDHHNKVWDICDFMKKQSDLFLKKCGKKYLELYYSVFMAYPQVQSMRSTDLLEICQKVITSNEYPKDNTEIIVEGTLETYKEKGDSNLYYRLKDSTLEIKSN